MEGFSGYNASKLCVRMFESETEGLRERERESEIRFIKMEEKNNSCLFNYALWDK